MGWKRRERMKEEAVQGSWSDEVDGEGEQKGDGDVMAEDEGVRKTNNSLGRNQGSHGR